MILGSRGIFDSSPARGTDSWFPGDFGSADDRGGRGVSRFIEIGAGSKSILQEIGSINPLSANRIPAITTETESQLAYLLLPIRQAGRRRSVQISRQIYIPNSMPKSLCELKKLLKKDMRRYIDHIDAPRFVCKTCGRVANEKRMVCDPKRLPICAKK